MALSNKMKNKVSKAMADYLEEAGWVIDVTISYVCTDSKCGHVVSVYHDAVKFCERCGSKLRKRPSQSSGQKELWEAFKKGLAIYKEVA
jgi:rRNA maturation endonuclease Nob1